MMVEIIPVWSMPLPLCKEYENVSPRDGLLLWSHQLAGHLVGKVAVKSVNTSSGTLFWKLAGVMARRDGYRKD